MKKLLSLTLAVITMSLLSGCGGSPSDTSGDIIPPATDPLSTPEFSVTSTTLEENYSTTQNLLDFFANANADSGAYSIELVDQPTPLVAMSPTGEISFITSPDYEVIQVITFTVKLVRADDPSIYSQTTLTINITDIMEAGDSGVIESDLIDDYVSGVDYFINDDPRKFTTNSFGRFLYRAGNRITFKVGSFNIGNITQSKIKSDNKVFIQDLFDLDRSDYTHDKIIKTGRFLQSLDSDPTTPGIQVTTTSKLKINFPPTEVLISDPTTPPLTTYFTNPLDIVSIAKAKQHIYNITRKIDIITPGLTDNDADIGADAKITMSAPQIDNSNKTSVSFTIEGVDIDAKAEISFNDSFNQVVVTDLKDGTHTVNLSTLISGDIVVTMSISDDSSNTAVGQGTVITNQITPIATLSSTKEISGVNATDNTFVVSISVSENVSGLSIANFSATNATIVSLSNVQTLYQAVISPDLDKTTTISISMNHTGVTDADGNAMEPVNSLNISLDNQIPTAIITMPGITTEYVNSLSPIAPLIHINFDETVTGLALDGLENPAGMGAYNVQGSNSDYTISTWFDPQDSQLTFKLKAGAVVDSSGNPNIETSFVVNVDNLPPTLSITTNATDPITKDNRAVNYTLLFSEPINNLTEASTTISGGVFDGLTQSTALGDEYVVAITANDDYEGPLTLTLLQNTITDKAGNMIATDIAISSTVSTMTTDIFPATLAGFGFTSDVIDPQDQDRFVISIVTKELPDTLQSYDLTWSSTSPEISFLSKNYIAYAFPSANQTAKTHTLTVSATDGTDTQTKDYTITLNPKQKIPTKQLVIKVSYPDVPFMAASKDAAGTHQYMFSDPDSVSNFILENSLGKAELSPAQASTTPTNTNTIGTVTDTDLTDGIIEYETAELSTLNQYKYPRTALLQTILTDIDEHIDFSTFDDNNDGSIQSSELNILFVFSLCARNWDPSPCFHTDNSAVAPTPGVWPASSPGWSGTSITVDGKKIWDTAASKLTWVSDNRIDTNNVRIILSTSDITNTAKHEFGHNLHLVKDLYAFTNLTPGFTAENTSVMYWGVMARNLNHMLANTKIISGMVDPIYSTPYSRSIIGQSEDIPIYSFVDSSHHPVIIKNNDVTWNNYYDIYKDQYIVANVRNGKQGFDGERYEANTFATTTETSGVVFTHVTPVAYYSSGTPIYNDNNLDTFDGRHTLYVDMVTTDNNPTTDHSTINNVLFQPTDAITNATKFHTIGTSGSGSSTDHTTDKLFGVTINRPDINSNNKYILTITQE